MSDGVQLMKLIRLSRNAGLVASFSRALLEELRTDMTQRAWDSAIDKSIHKAINATEIWGNSRDKGE